jgi:hypothetical protein
MFFRPVIIMVPVWLGAPSLVPANPPLLIADRAAFPPGAKLMPTFAGFLARLAALGDGVI